jgi:hypothetical protein
LGFQLSVKLDIGSPRARGEGRDAQSFFLCVVICKSLFVLFSFFGHYMSIFMHLQTCLSTICHFIKVVRLTEICQAVKLFDIDLIRRIQLCGSPNLLNMNVPDEGYSNYIALIYYAKIVHLLCQFHAGKVGFSAVCQTRYR